MPQAQRSIVIDVTPEQLLSVIGDFDSYPKFLPEIRKIQVLRREGDVAEVAYEIEVIKKISYVLKTVTEGMTVNWQLVRGDLFKKNEGSWKLRPEGEGRTHATYTLDIAFGGFIPVPASITSKLAETSLPGLLDNFKKRAESLFPKPRA